MHLKPKYQDRTFLLRGKHQNRSKAVQLGIGEYQKSLEDLTLNSQDKISLNNGAFIFTGSKLIDGSYLAEISGSIIAVYADEEAVINSMAHDSNNDDVWVANLKDMPELEVLVTIRLHLPRNP